MLLSALRQARNVGGNHINLTMTQSGRRTSFINRLCRTVFPLLIVISIYCCNSQTSSKDTSKSVDTTFKVAPESLHFTAHIIEKHDDGSKAEIDTVTGYQKYYYKNG